MLARIKIFAKHLACPWVYSYPYPQLTMDRLYLYLHTLFETREVAGAVVEVGCFYGGTAACAHRFLRSISVERAYLCVDTFGGFPQKQFARDVELGTNPSLAKSFSANSKSLVRKLLDQWDCAQVNLIQSDITLLNESLLPARIAVALIDVDLAVPTKAALEKIIPRVSPGGVILIDDCDMRADGFHGARLAADQCGLPVKFRFGMGIIDIPK